MTLRRIEVIDAGEAASEPVAVFEGAQLHDILQFVGSPPPKEAASQLSAGATSVIYLLASGSKICSPYHTVCVIRC